MPGLRALSFASLLALAACAPGGTEPTTRDQSADQMDGASTMLAAAAGGVTLRLESVARFEDRGGLRAVVVRGSASRDLTSVFSWVPDDAFGEATLLTRRKFEVVLDEAHEINSMLSGLPLHLTLNVAHGATPTVDARFVLAPAFTRFQGSGALFLEKDVRPVLVRGEENPLRYRGTVSGDAPLAELAVEAERAGADPVTTRVDEDTFRFDWAYEGIVLAADPATQRLHVDAVTEDGDDLAKSARIDITVRDLELTTLDPYEAWNDTCAEEVAACIATADAAGQDDLGDCGRYRDVQRCLRAQQ